MSEPFFHTEQVAANLLNREGLGLIWGSSAVSVQVDERCGSNAHIARISFVFRDLSCFHARCYRWSRLA